MDTNCNNNDQHKRCPSQSVTTKTVVTCNAIKVGPPQMSEGDKANNSLGRQSINYPHCMVAFNTKRKPECQTIDAHLMALLSSSRY